ncbi:MAG: hypothetical protein HY047_04515 [Acidobacteria bacterium]|nr:hypothetical protein [Acidobacteriota bacterium]
MLLTARTPLGAYEIISAIGAGGMGGPRLKPRKFEVRSPGALGVRERERMADANHDAASRI